MLDLIVLKPKFRWTEPHFIFALIALVVGFIFIQIIPPLWGVDETTHFARAYQISTGRLTEQRLKNGAYGGNLPSGIASLYNDVLSDLTDNNAADFKEVNNNSLYQKYESEPIGSKTVSFNFIGSGIYSPIAYAAPSVGIFIARLIHPTIGSAIFGARFMTLLLYIFLVAMALYLLRQHKAKWLVFVIGLLPISIFQASIVNVDSVAIGSSLLLFALILRLWKRRTVSLRKWDIAALGLTSLLVALTKPNYLLLTLIVPILLIVKYKENRDKLRLTLVMLAIIFIPWLLWNLSVHGIITGGSVSQRPGIHLSLMEQARYVTSHPLAFAKTFILNVAYSSWYQQSIGLLGFNFVMVPEYVLFLITIALALSSLMSIDRRDNGKTFNVTLLIFGVLTVISIIVGFYLTYTPIGSKSIDGVQGRYFIPALPFIFYALANFFPIQLKTSERFARIFFPVMMVFCALISIAWYYKVTY